MGHAGTEGDGRSLRTRDPHHHRHQQNQPGATPFTLFHPPPRPPSLPESSSDLLNVKICPPAADELRPPAAASSVQLGSQQHPDDATRHTQVLSTSTGSSILEPRGEGSKSNGSTSRPSLPPSAPPALWGGAVRDRCAEEDAELETRTLTEPLPSNQQAYKSHHLYALERWLTRYQVLHPRGPVLGFCGGHEIFPRSCVRLLHTRDRWMRECRRVRAGEQPVK
eukprot:jgi/Mesen1/5826/ME000297S05032